MKSRDILRPAQLRVIEELKSSTGLQLVMGMGGGKTASFLTAVAELLAAGTIRAAIVVAPVRVALTTWPNEISSWEHLCHLDAVVLAGSPEKRLKLLKEKHDLYICSIDSMVWLIDALRKFKADDPRWDMLGIDELSRFKSARGERAKKLNRFAERFKAVIGLTGTPRPNGYTDQWMPLNIVSGGYAWGTGYDGWLEEHFKATDFQKRNWEIRPEHVARVQKVIDDWTLTIPPEESTDVPFNSGPEFDVVVPLTPAQKADLADLEKDLLIEIGAEGTEVLDDSEETVAALSQATATQKAAQILQGFLYRDGQTVQTYTDAKLKALDDLLAGADGENVIIVYNYRYDLERLKKHLPTARWVDREQSDEDFVALIDACRKGEVQYLLAHVANLGHGVDGLQHGFARMIWFEVSWSSESTIQLIRRIARPGQTRPVFSHRIVADHWLEQKRIERVERKIREEQDFIATLRTL
jgi:superfamily II DNA or RNA helicase